jgi:hypothetical protein
MGISGKVILLYALHFFRKMPMFHVEHMKFELFFLFSLLFFGLGCTKANPEAYRSDPILLDYISQQGATHNQLEGINKEMEKAKKAMRNSVPQSGQYSTNAKKLHELEDRADKLNQQIQFWKIRIEGRAKEAQAEYLEAYKNKKEWPDKTKLESYFAAKRLRQAKMQWDQKDRIEEYHKNNKGLVPDNHQKNIQNVQSGGHE